MQHGLLVTMVLEEEIIAGLPLLVWEMQHIASGFPVHYCGSLLMATSKTPFRLALRALDRYVKCINNDFSLELPVPVKVATPHAQETHLWDPVHFSRS